MSDLRKTKTYALGFEAGREFERRDPALPDGLPAHAYHPRTKAGKRLLGKNMGTDPALTEWLANDIWAIESEAATEAPETSGLREALQDIANHSDDPASRNIARAALAGEEAPRE